MPITPTDLDTLDYVYEGEPFADVPVTSAVVLAGMDYVYRGEPFVANDFSAAVGSTVDPFGMMGIFGI